jgi:CYTH domain-containing protein
MVEEIELERTYLLKRLPEGIERCESYEILDIYLPSSSRHPILRIRRAGKSMAITKKHPMEGKDLSRQLEQTIPLNEDEFGELSSLAGKRVRKTRYKYDSGGRAAEIDVFKDGLQGLALADFEFGSAEEMAAFEMPDFCLAEVTQEEFLAGGMLCGKSYSDIEGDLARYGYVRI